MRDAAHARTVAELLGLPFDDDADRSPQHGVRDAYDALPAVDAESGPTPGDVTVDPDVAADEFNAFVATFELATESAEERTENAGARTESVEERTGSEGKRGDATLAGVDVAVKDNVAVAGVPLTAGVRAFADARPARHAPVVSRLLDADATIVGKTNMDTLAYGPTGETSGFGPTRNPSQPAHVAGGSSAGSGAAVAAGVVDAALGTDTGGSVRIPASFCGVVGYKPSFGVVPRAGVVPLAPSLDQVGVLASTVADAARVADVVAGLHVSDPVPRGRSVPPLADRAVDPPAVANCSFGLAEEFLGPHVDPAVRGCVERAVDELEAAGATVEHVSVPRFDGTAPAWDAIANVEFAVALFAGLTPLDGVGVDAAWHADVAAVLSEDWEAETDGDDDASDQLFSDRVVENALDGASLLAESGGAVYQRALAECERFATGFRDAVDGHDALLAPTMPVTAPAVGEWPLSAAERSASDATDRPPLSVNVRQANLLGSPALSLPCGRERGLPVGLQLLAAPGEDAALVAAASAVAAELR